MFTQARTARICHQSHAMAYRICQCRCIQMGVVLRITQCIVLHAVFTRCSLLLTLDHAQCCRPRRKQPFYQCFLLCLRDGGFKAPQQLHHFRRKGGRLPDVAHFARACHDL